MRTPSSTSSSVRGSLSDVEFTVQLLQLRHHVPGASTLDALLALVEAGHLPPGEADVLEEAYRFCEGVRNRGTLVVGSGDSLPTRPEQATALARSVGVHRGGAPGGVSPGHTPGSPGGGAALLRPRLTGYWAMMAATGPTGPG